MKRLAVTALACVLYVPVALGQNQKPRVFITDSASWEIRGAAFGTMNGAYQGNAGSVHGTYASSMAGGARPQTAEIIKTFGERCPEAVVNNKQEKADYVVVLDHEGGKGVVRRRNKIAVFNRDGDAIVSHSTRSLGNSVKDACAAIVKDWGEHSGQKPVETAGVVSKSITHDEAPPPQKTSSVPKKASEPPQIPSSAQSAPSSASGLAANTSSPPAPVAPSPAQNIPKTDPPRDASQGGYFGATSNENPRVRHDGVLLSGVEREGPAYQAGLQAGDVIVSIDGNYMYTVADLATYIQQHAPGSRIVVKYLRGANYYDTYVILGGTARF